MPTSLEHSMFRSMRFYCVQKLGKLTSGKPNTFLNGLAVPNKYRMLPESLNVPFCRNSLNVLDCCALSLERSVSGCRQLDTAFSKTPQLKKIKFERFSLLVRTNKMMSSHSPPFHECMLPSCTIRARDCLLTVVLSIHH